MERQGTLLHLSLSFLFIPDNILGKYMIPWARLGTPTDFSQDPAVGKKVWDWLEGEVEKFEAANPA